MTTISRSSKIPGMTALARGAHARVGADHALPPAARIPFTTRLSLRFGLKVLDIEVSQQARAELETQLLGRDQLLIVAKTPCSQQRELQAKRAEVRRTGAPLEGGRTVFLEVDVRATANPRAVLELDSAPGDAHTVLKVAAPAAANALAGALLSLRAELGIVPHIYFSWSERNPIHNAASYVLAGRGDTAVIAREILRRAEPDRRRRPTVHVG